MNLKLEVLISSLKKDINSLISHMNLECDAVVVNQGVHDGSYGLETRDGYKVRVIESNECGVGKSRNAALDNAEADIVLFSDDDIVYLDGYSNSILKAFENCPDADVIMFNVNVCDDRRTYYIDKSIRVHKWSVGRYPTYAAAARLDRIRDKQIRFSLLFGGGAKYSCGEDSLFFMDCLRAGLRIQAVPVTIGTEEPRESTWFLGYDEKFFKDRGVLYVFLYDKLATFWALRFVFAKKKLYQSYIKPRTAFKHMKNGIREGKNLQKEIIGKK